MTDVTLQDFSMSTVGDVKVLLQKKEGIQSCEVYALHRTDQRPKLNTTRLGMISFDHLHAVEKEMPRDDRAADLRPGSGHVSPTKAIHRRFTTRPRNFREPDHQQSLPSGCFDWQRQAEVVRDQPAQAPNAASDDESSDSNDESPRATGTSAGSNEQDDGYVGGLDGDIES